MYPNANRAYGGHIGLYRVITPNHGESNGQADGNVILTRGSLFNIVPAYIEEDHMENEKGMLK